MKKVGKVKISEFKEMNSVEMSNVFGGSGDTSSSDVGGCQHLGDCCTFSGASGTCEYAAPNPTGPNNKILFCDTDEGRCGSLYVPKDHINS